MVVEVVEKLALNWDLVGDEADVVVQLVLRGDYRCQAEFVELWTSGATEYLYKRERKAAHLFNPSLYALLDPRILCGTSRKSFRNE